MGILVSALDLRYYWLVRIFKNTWFARFADKEGITDNELREVAEKLEAGQPDVDLGGDVYKMRVARPSEGKSGGYRIIVFFRSGERTFFAYGFAKSDKGNINRKELKEYKALAKKYFDLSNEMIERAIKLRKFFEV